VPRKFKARAKEGQLLPRETLPVPPEPAKPFVDTVSFEIDFFAPLRALADEIERKALAGPFHGRRKKRKRKAAQKKKR